MTISGHFFSYQFIHALGWTLVHSFWQATLIAVVLAALLYLLRRHAASLRYVISIFGLIAVLGLAFITFVRLYQPHPVAIAANGSTEVITSTNANIFHKSLDTAMHSLPNASLSDLFSPHLNAYLPGLVMIWMIGVLFFTFRFFGGWVYLQHLKYDRTIPLPGAWQNRMNELCRKMHLSRQVQVMESMLARVPLVIGYFKPVVLLPVGMLSGLSVEQVEAILAHEIAHIARGDYLINILQTMVEIIFFYHPAIWWMSNRVRRERENCCDDMAVSLSADSLTLAHALTQLGKSTQPVPDFALAMMTNRRCLLNRIKRIVHPQPVISKTGGTFWAVIVCIGSLFVLSIGAGAVIDVEKPNSLEKSENLLAHLKSDSDDPQMKTDSTQTENVEVEILIKAEGAKVEKNNNTHVIEFQYDSDKNEQESGTYRVVLDKTGAIIELFKNGKKIPSEKIKSYQHIVGDVIIIESKTVKKLEENDLDEEYNEKEFENREEDFDEYEIIYEVDDADSERLKRLESADEEILNKTRFNSKKKKKRSHRLFKELKNDNFIHDDGTVFLEIKGDSLFINGKKQSPRMFEKYLKIVTEAEDLHFHKKSKESGYRFKGKINKE